MAQSNTPKIIGARLFKEILYQTAEFGAMTVLMLGSLGAGKSTLLKTLAEAMTCRDPITKTDQPVTIIWKTRETDIWNSFTKNSTYVFVYVKDIEYVTFRYEESTHILTESEIEKDLPQIITYKSIPDLANKLVKGSINCIYEPQKYTLSKYLSSIIKKRGCQEKHLEDPHVDKSLWWIEFMYYVLKHKGIDFLGFIYDEFDEMLPSGMGGIQWHAIRVFRDILRECRKKNVCVIMCTHQKADLDPSMMSKVLTTIYLKGAKIPADSMIGKNAAITLSQGRGFIERDGWGVFEFDKLKMKSKIDTAFIFPEDRQEFIPESDESEVSKKTSGALKNTGIVDVNNDGKLEFDTAKLSKMLFEI